MCLVRAWNVGLVAREPALRLSHQRTEAVRGYRRISVSKDLTQVTSTAKLASARYSDSVLERAMACCLRED